MIKILWKKSKDIKFSSDNIILSDNNNEKHLNNENKDIKKFLISKISRRKKN